MKHNNFVNFVEELSESQSATRDNDNPDSFKSPSIIDNGSLTESSTPSTNFEFNLEDT